MKTLAFLGLAAAAALATTAQAQSVSANAATPTLIGTFGPGTYNVTTTGIISLTGGTDFLVDANGQPQGTVTTPGYDYFNPNGSFTADGSFGPAGSSIKIGALAGTYDPAGATGYFLLGTNSTLTFTLPTVLYGLVNDTFPSNNSGSFTVNVAAVPEPATWGLMILGFGAIGYAARRKVRAAVRFA